MQKFRVLLKDFFKGYKTTLTLGFTILCMQLMLSILSIVTAIDIDWVKLLSILMALIGLVIVFMLAKSVAYKDVEVFKNNRARRKMGETIPRYKVFAEQNYFKGFLSGIFAFLPTLILIVLGAIFGGELNIPLAIARVINFVYYAPVANYFGIQGAYILFVFGALQSIVVGVSYYISAKVYVIQYEELQERSEKRRSSGGAR